MDGLSRLQDIVSQVREKAGAIKAAPSPVCGGKDALAPSDASSKLLTQIDYITGMAVDARESLQAFI